MSRGTEHEQELFVWDDGLPHPNWGEFVARMDPELDTAGTIQAWLLAEKQWLAKLGQALGDDYRTDQSACGEITLLNAMEPKPTKLLLKAATAAVRFLREHLRAIELPDAFGNFVLIAPSQFEDYYRYIGHFYSEGEHTQSSGVFLNTGYGHIAIAPHDLEERESTAAHELSHDFVSHLGLPAWVDEGLACTVEHTVMGIGHPELTRDLVNETRAHWNDVGEDMFWSGDAFHSVESTSAAYLTAEVIVRRMLLKFRKRFAGFLKDAAWDPRADVAARRHFGIRTYELAPDLLPTP